MLGGFAALYQDVPFLRLGFEFLRRIFGYFSSGGRHIGILLDHTPKVATGRTISDEVSRDYRVCGCGGLLGSWLLLCLGLDSAAVAARLLVPVASVMVMVMVVVVVGWFDGYGK